MKGFEIVLVNYKERVYIPLAKLRQIATDLKGNASVALQPVDSWRDSYKAMHYGHNFMPVKTYRLTDILASEDFVEVIVPKPALMTGRSLLFNINKELEKVTTTLGVDLKEEMIYWED